MYLFLIGPAVELTRAPFTDGKSVLHTFIMTAKTSAGDLLKFTTTCKKLQEKLFYKKLFDKVNIQDNKRICHKNERRILTQRK